MTNNGDDHKMFDELGLTYIKHHLMWTEHGALWWAPELIKSTIVVVHNYITCRLFGHEFYKLNMDSGPLVCIHCSKEYDHVE